jgi:predicted Zn-dependent peptidase
MSDLTAASLDDIRDFFSTWYRPDNAVLTLVGDFAPGEAKRLIDDYFGEIEPGRSFPKFTAERKPMHGQRRETVPSLVQLPRTYRLYHLPKIGEPDWIHGDLLSTILASDKASRLERSLVHEKQIAQDVAAYILPTEATGMLLLHATAKEDTDIDTIEAAIDEEIARIAGDGITEDELTRAKNRAEVEFAHQLENYDMRADLIGMLTTFFDDPALVNRWLEPYDKATADDLARVSKRYLVSENCATSVFTPQERDA